MKIMTVTGLAGQRILTGSTSAVATGPTPAHGQQGVAVSMVPPSYQKRLENGEQLTSQDLEAIREDIGRKIAL